MNYTSTRGQSPDTDFTGALMQGLAPDGGLYLPKTWPKPAFKKGASYIETALAVLAPFMAGFASHKTLKALLEDTYTPRADGFSTPLVTPLRQLDKNLSVLELFHGPTLAFKDVALQLLGRLFGHQLANAGGTLTILGATSGDTGSAAIEGCRHASGARIFILYPHGRPSEVQRRQMTTVAAPNVHALAVEGNFDDCQAIVKTLFSDAAFKARHGLSAVNSINWARIAAQIVYYVHASLQFDEPVNFIVPTGNFGNIFAARAAKHMGANIGRLVVASNRNDILPRFFETGRMQAAGVTPSLSPSMDIEISSNFERLLYETLGADTKKLSQAMDHFKKTGHFDISAEQLANLKQTFMATRCSDSQTLETMATTQKNHGYTIDPHTAAGFYAYQMLGTALQGPTVALACAHPAKFPDTVQKATGITPALPHGMADLYTRPERFKVLPASAAAIAGEINGI